ncbi:hypothetical protein EPUS_02311 [Endocarpon pusillum Z07020]|uniref:Uncharacterized protein n=1 Tax=Endocarpon pusillum (strain Z07020 / HMAS-L-300199) TaxID=1263415 RepID=U1GGH4_ENDPU|nr:uncharacterized protein EPUS_02311 [Endocarpon pusillum Z07020]ERF76772.1 hypothetical protein EPUS_02311 [Endocarpon pusillum Z07020]
MAASSPLTLLSPSVQNTKQKSPLRIDQHNISESEHHEVKSSKKCLYTMSTYVHRDSSEDDDFHNTPSRVSISPCKGTTKGAPSDGTPSPIKLASPTKTDIALDSTECANSPFPESTLRVDEGLIRECEAPTKGGTEPDDTTMRRNIEDEGMSTIMHDKEGANQQESGEEEADITLSIDDTANDISAFSAIPEADLTRFAALHNSTASPIRPMVEGWSPSKQLRNPALGTPATVKRPLRLSTHSQSDNGFDNDATPRRPYSASSSEDLLNFTGQSSIIIPPPRSSSRPSTRRSPSGRGGFPIKINPSPAHRSQASVDRERSRGVISPVRQIPSPPTSTTPYADRRNHLLDFDLEPLATPRSVPSITPRELESLRSDLSSQICSLSATLSGKEAEVLALKRSITDAEVRVGNTSEELRNEKLLRESLEQEKQDWDRRGREMESVLREIRQEIMVGELERDKLRRQTEEAEKRTEEMEVRVVELQTRLESANRRKTLSPTSSPRKKTDELLGEPATPLVNGNGVNGMDMNEAVREATERVARDLHALYKSKHETKVAALKKSYEARWEKKVRHLEDELKSTNTEILNLKTERDATMSGPLASSMAVDQQLQEQTRRSEDLLREKEQMEANAKVLQAQIEGLEAEVQSVKQLTDNLREELEKERAEKGELVAQVDLFLALGDDQSAAITTPQHNGMVGLKGEAKLRSVSSDSIASSAASYSAARHSVECHQTQQATHHHQQPPQQQSPAKPHSAVNGRAAAGAGGTGGRPRPMSMLQPPGKFSGIPGPGGVRGSGKALPARTAGVGGGGIMEGIAKMGAGAAGKGY